MTKYLDRLLDLGEPNNKTSKKSFVSRNFEKIEQAIALGHSNKTIIAAIEKDGVSIPYKYFSELLSAEYERRGIEKQKRVNNGKLPVKPVESKSHRAGLGDSPEPKEEKADSGLSPEKQAVKDELDRIRDDNSLTLAQKREAAAKATASLVNKNPLANRK